MKFEIVSYDVWGNEKDGYDINQSFSTGLCIEIADPYNVPALIKELKKEYLRDRLRASTFEIDGDADYSLYLTRTIKGKITAYPVLELRRIGE